MIPNSQDTAQHQKAALDAQKFPVPISKRPYPIPSRTRKSSSSEPMVLHGQLCGRVGRCRVNPPKAPVLTHWGFAFLSRAGRAAGAAEPGGDQFFPHPRLGSVAVRTTPEELA